jgi:putative tryptophan/tyrosine transport system substrate-binding protein
LILAIKPAPLKVGLVFDPNSEIHRSIRPRAVEIATSLGLMPQLFQCGSPDELNRLSAELGEARLEFVVFFTAPLFHVNRHRIAEMTRVLGLPAVHGEREHTEAGDLLSFGINYAASWKRAAVFVDKILKGEKPGDIPIEQPPLLELVVNLATARSLDLDIPTEILDRADKVIE